MQSFSEFFGKFGWPEILISVAIILLIAGIHEWRNVVRLFTNGENKKDSFNTKE